MSWSSKSRKYDSRKVENMPKWENHNSYLCLSLYRESSMQSLSFFSPLIIVKFDINYLGYVGYLLTHSSDENPMWQPWPASQVILLSLLKSRKLIFTHKLSINPGQIWRKRLSQAQPEWSDSFRRRFHWKKSMGIPNMHAHTRSFKSIYSIWGKW